MPSLIIITGASKGYGNCLWKCIPTSITASPDTRIILTARDKIDLKNVANITFLSLDLLQHKNIDAIVAALPRTKLDYSIFDSVYLFNNAGSLGKLDRIETQTRDTIESAINLNVTSPMILTSAFLRHFKDFDGKLFIINVSSLAAIQAFDCWGVYSAGKAARDMYFKTIAIEEEEKAKDTTYKRTVRVLNFAPGPLDTNMQSRIRNELPDVPTRAYFREMHEKGTLVDPKVSASALWETLVKDEFESGEHIDFYQLYEI